MNKKNLSRMIFATALLLFAACSQGDPMGDNGTTLPEGEYPLEIASVTMDVTHSQHPWDADVPQTRVSENTDRGGSHWDNGDKIKVQIAGGTPGTYTYQDGNLTVTDGDVPAYWASTANNQPIRAWHTSSGNETVELGDQTEGLAYVLTAQATANFDTQVSLAFTHALAKVRVVLSGTQSGEVKNVKINNYTTCTHTQGGSVTGGNEGWITMYKVNATTYEANVVPFTAIPADFIHVNDQAADVSGITELTQGAVHTIDLTVGEPVTVLTADNRNITQEGHYRVSGSFPYAITISGNISPTIYLDNANINVGSGNAISITGGANATIHITGNNTVTNPQEYSNGGAGIYVAEGSSVTITGRDRNDVLTAQAGVDGAGIGGYGQSSSSYTPCGDITINNVTVYAYSALFMTSSPGIGSRESCGTITINNATVYARGTAQGIAGCPAIGSYSSVPTIVISGSDIYAYRGGESQRHRLCRLDWAGWRRQRLHRRSHSGRHHEHHGL